ncbi:MAG: von Willebrand factor type A domain-containing protein [Prolixibacteraceae bacterium]|nr:von Willebrand factor type A domain-containing protein [Prolixibacteraceae bacterium]
MKAKIFILLALFLTIGTTKAHAQQVIKGKVTNQQYQSLNGVIVIGNNQQQGVRTNQEGIYELVTDSLTKFIRFEMPGMNPLEVPVNQLSVMNVSLTESLNPSIEQHSVISGSALVRQKSIPVHTMAHIKNGSRIMVSYEPVDYNTENYALIRENTFQPAADEPLSTFSIDVDKAAYTNIRRFINNGQLPPKDAVRIEEMINYFHYNYPPPEDNATVSMITTHAACPWNKQHQLLFIGLQGKNMNTNDLPPANLVFLIDVSGSMQALNKLPLVKTSLKMLVDTLRDTDRIAIVTYAGAAQIVLNSTPAAHKSIINKAIDGLKAGGSTAGADGLQLAYQVAATHFIREGNNRIIMATDGDFNVGQSSDAEMERLVSEQGRHNIALTVLGFGMGNLKDNRLELLAQGGNGHYAYIDNSQEAYRSLVSEFGGTMFTIARDMKIQVEFNPAHVKAYRQVGYENRKLNQQDFIDTKRDAGDMGAGHQVTVIYEMIPTTSNEVLLDVDPLRYQQKQMKQHHSNELANIKIRYIDAGTGKEMRHEHVVNNNMKTIDETPEAFRFASSVAQFGMLLRDSPFKGMATTDSIVKLARSTLPSDKGGYREEFIRLVKTAASLGLTQEHDDCFQIIID